MITHHFETLLTDFQDHILTITINRPEKLNALNLQVLTELRTLFIDLGANLQQGFDLKGVILTGSGEKAFIAGADISEMENMNGEEAFDFSRLGQEVTKLMELLPVPIIAAVNGFALGGGLEMALACDFIYATENAVVGQPEVKLGLIPGFGGTQRLTRNIGRPMARELIYSGRNVKAEEAFRLGLIQKICKNKDELLLESKAIFKMIQGNSPLAIALCKKVILNGSDLRLEEGLEMELSSFSEAFTYEDMKEGTRAFIEKRKPIFTGK